MLTEMTGDILNVKDGIICHQVNYFGVMGGGVAAAIAENILTEEQYQAYAGYCKQAGRTALGTVQFLGCSDGLIVANMFCQDDARARGGVAEGGITDYDAMRRCFVRVRSMAQVQGKRVYIPHNIGCGIAGGDWSTVKFIMEDAFKTYPVEAFILARKGARQ